MCGRFALFHDASAIAEQLGVAEPEMYAARYNIAPTQPVMALRAVPDSKLHKKELSHFFWGLMPRWAKDFSYAGRMINSRSETVAEKPSFKAPFKYRRCVVPMSGFYEWQKVGKQKQPHYIGMASGDVFGVAGIWETWGSPDGSELQSISLLTTEPNDFMKPLHNRMPVILHKEDYEEWMFTDPTEVDRLTHLFRPFPSEAMTAYPVTHYVGKATNEGIECIEPMPKADTLF